MCILYEGISLFFQCIKCMLFSFLRETAAYIHSLPYHLPFEQFGQTEKYFTLNMFCFVTNSSSWVRKCNLMQPNPL